MPIKSVTRFAAIILAGLFMVACKTELPPKKDEGPPPLPAHPVGKVSTEALPPPTPQPPPQREEPKP